MRLFLELSVYNIKRDIFKNTIRSIKQSKFKTEKNVLIKIGTI